MDKKCRQEIRNYIVVFLLMVLGITAAAYGFAGYEENLKQNQIAELIGQYPEMETDLIRILEKGGTENRQGTLGSRGMKDQQRELALERLENTYGYHFGTGMFRSRIWILWGICVGVSGIFLILLWILSGRKKVRQEAEAEHTRMNLEESLKEARTHIEDLTAQHEKEEENTKVLITNISHQLKTPLASLRMSHELLASNYLTEEEKQEFLQQEGAQIQKLQLLLDEMIKTSRLEKSMITLKPKNCSLRHTISEAVSTVWPKAAAKSIQIQVEMEDDLVIRHDTHWTAEAFANILDNAVKYAPEHTDIIITVHQIGQNVLLEFMDEGPGIPDDEKHKIYQRFYRGKNSQGTEGAGVGLYLTRRILEDQGGSILVKNRYPNGNTFRVLMPS